jgi:hypothetical protein
MFLLAGSFLAISSNAALAPFYQTLGEIQTILNDARVRKSLTEAANGPIDSVVKATDGRGGFIVKVGGASLRAVVQYKPFKKGDPIGQAIITGVAVSPVCVAKKNHEKTDPAKYYASVEELLAILGDKSFSETMGEKTSSEITSIERKIAREVSYEIKAGEFKGESTIRRDKAGKISNVDFSLLP